MRPLTRDEIRGFLKRFSTVAFLLAFVALVDQRLTIAANSLVGIGPSSARFLPWQPEQGSQSTEPSNPNAQQAREHSERGLTFASNGDFENAGAELRIAVALAPRNAQYLYALGAVLAQQGKLQEAINYFQQAVKLDPTNLVIRRNLAAAEWQIGDLEDAEKNLELILQHRPNDADVSFLLGMVLENRGTYAKAAKLLAAAHGQLNAHPEAVAALLHCYYETSQLVEAHSLEDTLLKDPSQTQPILMSAGVAERAGDYPSAEKMLTALHDLYPSSSEVNYQFAILRYRMDAYSEAEAILRQLISEDGEARYFNLLAWCLAKEDRISEAVQVFDRAINLAPGEDSNYVDLATALMRADLLAPALEAATKAIEVAPGSYNAYRVRGQIQMRQHDLNAAVESYGRAAELNNSSPEALLDLAGAQAAAGQFRKASALLQASIKKYPRVAQFYYQYAVILIYHSDLEQRQSQSQAMVLLEKTLALDHSIAGAYYELGNIYLQQNQAAKAVAELQEAEKLDPSDENTHYSLWIGLRKLGRQQEAEEELQSFRRLKGKSPDSDKSRQ